MIDVVSRDTAVRVLRSRQEELTKDAKRIHDRLQAIEQSIAAILEGPNEDASPSVDIHRLTDMSLGPQPMVEQFLREAPGRFFRPSEIARLLVQQGYHRENMELWPTQVNNCLKRAIEKDVAETRVVEGKKVYGLKQETEKVPNKND
jgi:hypothetical protein